MAQPDLDHLAGTLRELAAALQRATRTDSLSRPAASTLSWLAGEGAMRITTLAEREAVTQPAMTGLVQRLEASGLVVRRSDARDGRVVLIDITPAGREALERRRAVQDAVIRDRLAGLSTDDLAALEAALPALYTVTELHAA
ncbi:MarR family transcriptional regulator [Aeromicrobium sp. NPDC092404]|uniref:MarR family winged helix-turn-helix transcriptional regulator n=1 Tax=Aeromicrobium sp. NPDC092404 TaxID=3154976 RepID=UPI00341A97AC